MQIILFIITIYISDIYCSNRCCSFNSKSVFFSYLESRIYIITE